MITNFQEDVHYFEIHYVLNLKGDHSLNAFVLNRAQYQFLLFANEVANLCGVKIEIESQAITEGGIRDTWKIFGKNANQIAAILAALALLATIYQLFRDRGLSDLQRESLHLDIELKKQQIEEYKKRQLAVLRETVRVTSPDTVQEVADHIKIQVEVSDKAKILRSKFFHKLSEEAKVNSLEFNGFKNGKKIFEPKVIERENFDKFILKSDELPPDNHKSALIEIVAPVISKGRYKWKGKFCDESIDFRLLDKSFKQEVLNGKVSFKSGIAIECELEIQRKIDDNGNERVTGYDVHHVNKVIEEGTVKEMPQRIVRKKKDDGGALPIFEALVDDWTGAER